MKILPVTSFNTKTTNIMPRSTARFDSPAQQGTDSVSFKGAKNALKGAGIFGAIGAVTGAVISGGATLIPAIIYFAACDGLIGGIIGANIDDNV